MEVRADDARSQTLRELPSVDVVARCVKGPHALVVDASRKEIAELRRRLQDGEGTSFDLETIVESVRERLRAVQRPSLRPLINATGIVLHTNLGRAPLAPEAIDQISRVAAGYANLEYRLSDGSRHSRAAHLDALLVGLTGAEAALAVNNNAAAVLLALGAVSQGKEVIVSRGELIEIGGSFRLPEVIATSGARLVEVGTTNRTMLDDYAEAITSETAALLRVHQSNFRMTGFTEAVATDDLATLANDRGLTFVNDLGSGVFEPIADEPLIGASVASGAHLTCFSGDKLLGGPQAGIIVGHAELVSRCQKHPLARALRLDKLQLTALEATLRKHRDEGSDALPALRMLKQSDTELLQRARRVADGVGESASVGRSAGESGGGTLPGVPLEGPVCLIVSRSNGPEEVVARLRTWATPVIARVHRHAVVIDPRTFSDDEALVVVDALRSAID